MAASSHAAAPRRVNWGDVEQDDDLPLSPSTVGAVSSSSSSSSHPVVPLVSQSAPDAKGIKTIVEYGTNAQGEKVKITRKVKVVSKQVKVNKHVLERQDWEKFGDCKGLPKGPEQNITYQSFEIIHLDLRPKKREEEKEESSLDKLSGTSSIVVCRNCGETGHWTLKCPKRQNIEVFANKPDLQEKFGATDTTKPGVGAAGGRYVPVHMRGGEESKPVSSLRDEGHALRVTNLAEDVTEDDLADLFRRFGHTQRIYLARDRQTGESRGFAFVNYSMRRDAETAIENLNGHGYANLILRVEWAKPREERPDRE